MKRCFITLFLCILVSVVSAENTELPANVRSVMTVRDVPFDSLSIYVEDLQTGETVLNWLSDTPRNPASTAKLLTTLVSLDKLGPAYRWKTEVFALGEVDDGKLDGDLLIKGYGDPFLVTERVWQLMRNIRFAGIREIAGDLLIDDSYFDVGDYDPGAFDRQPLRAYNVAPNALLMNFNVARFWFEPDATPNGVKIRLDPPIENLRIRNELRRVESRCRGYQRGITINSNNRHNEVTFSGKFPSGCKIYAMDRAVLSHNEFVHGLFQALWQQVGGEFAGDWQNVSEHPAAEPLVTFESMPLGEMIARVNKHSNNVMARQLLYTLSSEVRGQPGTEKGGRQVIADWLRANGLEACEIAIRNGAGLSRETRMTATGMAALLKFAWRQPYMPEYISSMSISGLDGTLSQRFRDSELVGMAHLKTGSMDNVTAIAGYLQSKSGRRLAVVALHNYENIHRGPGEEVQQALLNWLYEQ